MAENENEKISTLIDVAIGTAVKIAVQETSKVTLQVLGERLSKEIIEAIKPLNVSEVDVLRRDVTYLNDLLRLIGDSLIGLLLIRRATKKLSKVQLQKVNNV